MSDITIFIRRATVLDLDDLLSLYNSDKNLFGEDETGYDPEDMLEYISDPKKKMFVASFSEKVVGALLAEYHETYVYLDTFIVDKELQGRGIGKLLMNHFEEDVKASNIPLIESLTEVENSKMQQFFESRDFKKGNQFIFYSKKIK